MTWSNNMYKYDLDYDYNKSNFRKECIKKLNKNSKISRIQKDKYVCTKIFELITLHKPSKILAYIPLLMEVNIMPLVNRLRKENICEVYTPYVIGKTFKAVKYRLPLNKNRFGIKEPKNTRLNVDIDLAIVPVIGIDATNRRIGFGSGMYDRFFGNLKKQPITIFIQRVLCKTNTIITSDYDIEANYIITGK
ncbi:5-formyltetrahydrofolate cyclo-ligase [hydrothermal vent metagenome]|uniref:5-formyltetrahydrofolate cyclo-ligase n=1 Tax=hydrothermal vent metagenome TaxID=652676 RepID=A0A3B1E4K0_9ZZZZ